MKIAIPTTDGKLCAHFGHCERFALVEADAAAKNVVSIQFFTPPPHEAGVLPRWLKEQGADLVIAGGMGGRAQALFAESGIRVIAGAPSETVETIVSAYLEGTLDAGRNLCDH
jgi:predicted Fe-Mo cluster-binding NifX family protein